jgi:hypothetical protein
VCDLKKKKDRYSVATGKKSDPTFDRKRWRLCGNQGKLVARPLHLFLSHFFDVWGGGGRTKSVIHYYFFGGQQTQS